MAMSPRSLGLGEGGKEKEHTEDSLTAKEFLSCPTI